MNRNEVTFKRTSPKGHRADAVAYPVNLGGTTVIQYFCSECGFDLEAAPRGRWWHCNSRDGARWINR